MNNSKSNSKSNLKTNNRHSSLMFQAETPKEEAKRKILAAVKRDAGKYINFESENVSGLFVGACMYNNWPHFILLDKDRKPVFVNYNSTFKIVKEVPANLSILDYLRKTQEDYLYGVATDAVKNPNVSEQLGNIVIRYVSENSRYNKNSKNNKPKKNKKS